MQHDEINESESPSRPLLVTILAILTIIWSVISLLGTFIPVGEAFPGLQENAPEPQAWIDWTNTACAALKFIAAILLLRMTKIGFYLYAAAELVTAVMNLIYGLNLFQWAQDNTGPGSTVDPTLVVIVMIGFLTALSMVWVGGFSLYLGRMK